MTNLIITVDESKKKLKFTGDKIALGERVSVEVVGIDVDANTRLRVLVGDTTIAIGGTWEGANCELNLFTVQAEKFHCGYGLVVLDDPEANKLYGIGELELLPWPKERGADVPYDLGNYPDVIEDFRSEINEKFTDQDSEIESALRNIEDDNETFKRAQLERQNTFEETVNTNVANKADAAALEEEIAARENADNALSARINTNKTNIETNAANISKANTAIEKEVSDRAKAVEAEKQSRLVAEGVIRESISSEATRATARENEIEATANRSMQKAEEVEDSLNNLVKNAPEALDTLEEIANYLKQDETGTAAILKDIASIREDKANRTELETETARAKGAEAALGEAIDTKVDTVEGKGLSTNDYTNEEKEKLGKAYSPDNPPPTPDLSDYAKKSDVEAAVEKSEEALAAAGDAAGVVSNIADSLEDFMPRYPLGVQPQITYNESDGSTNLILYSYANNKYVPSEGEIIHIHVAYSDKDQNPTYHKNDIELVVDCTNLTEAPKLKWWGVGVMPSILRPRTDAETDFACVAGVRNVYWISEYAEGEFVVAGWAEQAGVSE